MLARGGAGGGVGKPCWVLGDVGLKGKAASVPSLRGPSDCYVLGGAGGGKDKKIKP